MKFLVCLVLFLGPSLYALSAETGTRAHQPERGLFFVDSGKITDCTASFLLLNNAGLPMTCRVPDSVPGACGPACLPASALAYSEIRPGKTKRGKRCNETLQSWKARILFPVHYYW